ncbi:copper resistance CopC family protein [Microbacterium sp.]|uniref:copper resistance CopC family protein n=2 Tax=unclassified Microbacterium TaxID=2609290 RepID=UPI00092B307F|nr:copper resistance CopC family protein [Microbacterium sp.]MBN9190104.1 copper resistance protein CopC [Microbacterium sp.]MBN9191042.1 copper resistance protein CopC [Microbacterium sp.]OJU68191.1 MAG: hypothetical protein BGO04_10340 [Microbacterium sp. 70-38]
MSSRIHLPARVDRRASVLGGVLLAAVAGLVLLVASPASAHDELVGTDPAAGSTVAALPGAITLTFSDIVIDDGTANQVRVTDAAGSSLTDGSPQVQDNVVTQRLKGADAAAGTVTVLWRVVSRDGHPVSKSFTFTLAPAASSTPATSASATVAPVAPRPSASPTASSGGTGSSPAPWIILGALTVAAIAGTAYLVVSRGRRTPPPATDPPAESEGDADR